MTKKGKKLRSGYTTGASAAAAVKGALHLLVHCQKKSAVTIPFLSDGSVDIQIFSLKEKESHVFCSVIKDAGDDPDITNKAEIGAAVSIHESDKSNIVIKGGLGVGRITKPGLEVPPGEPAINPGPRKMIKQAVRDVIENFDEKKQTVDIEIFVPQGEILAKKTLNHRLGIIGGISILGTTGVVRPMSHDAYIATIRSSLSVALAAGIRDLYFTTGRRSERFAEEIFTSDPKEAFVQTGDFFGKSLEMASEMLVKQVVFVVFFGKAIKMAQGVYHTHAAKSSLSLDKLSKWTYDRTKNATLSNKIKHANTAREAFFMLKEDHTEVIQDVSKKIVHSAAAYASPHIHLKAIILDFQGKIIAESEFDRKDGSL
ncbi:MAG: cobalt-precorrin-5B (C(1))-methyltransferase [Desulfobacteraceae bacterium]|nr:cobalt-precorrin-5B (C(1))-methyltransferase [Desulfobacteraceae bacterium]